MIPETGVAAFRKRAGNRPTGAEFLFFRRFLVLCQFQCSADTGTALPGTICGIVRMLGARGIASRFTARRLANARCGGPTKVARGSRRDGQSHAASPCPACRADRRSACRSKTRRCQSSPASSGVAGLFQPANFTRAFRQATGLAPGQYRQTARSQLSQFSLTK